MPDKKKRYTLQQILDNVETIQKQYDNVADNPMRSSSCFFPLKRVTKLLRTFKTARTQSFEDEPCHYPSPFVFGGETLQWFVLPRCYHDHVYENQLLDELK